MIAELAGNSGCNIRSVIADGTYDGESAYQAICGKASTFTTKDRHSAKIALHGRMAWQRRHGYGNRPLVETAISRIKKINDGRLTSRTFGPQQTKSPFTSKSPTPT